MSTQLTNSAIDQPVKLVKLVPPQHDKALFQQLLDGTVTQRLRIIWVPFAGNRLSFLRGTDLEPVLDPLALYSLRDDPNGLIFTNFVRTGPEDVLRGQVLLDARIRVQQASACMTKLTIICTTGDTWCFNNENSFYAWSAQSLNMDRAVAVIS